MKQIYLILSSLLLTPLLSTAQVYSYNFGSVQDSLTTNTAITHLSANSFVPMPADGSTARIRVGAGGGKIVMKNYPFIGSGSAMRIQAPTSTSVNKFSIYESPAGTNTFALKVSFSIGDSLNGGTGITSGNFYLMAGNGGSVPSSNSFSSSGGFTGSQTFTGIQIQCGASNATVNFRVGTAWVAQSITIPYGTLNNVVMYMNNSSNPINYTDINGSLRTLAAGTWDFFSNGTFMGNVPKAALAANTVINSFMMYAESSAGNMANAFVDDIVYAGNIESNTLSVKLASFAAKTAGRNVQVSWKTESEDGISKYVVEHSTNGIAFHELGTVNSNNTAGSDYSYTHSNAAPVNYYRLKIVRNDGGVEYSHIIKARLADYDASLNAWYNNGNLYFANHQDATLQIADTRGNIIYTAKVNANQDMIALPDLPPSVYVAYVTDGDRTCAVKFIK